MMLGFQSCGCNCRIVLAAWQDAYFFRRASAVTRLKVKQQQQQHHVSFHQFDTSPATKTLRCKSSNTSDGFKSRLSGYNFNDIKRHESSKPKQRGLVKAVESPYAGLSPAQKVKEAGKDTAYTGVIIVGVGVTALMFYAIGKELFSKQSPSGVYGQALKLCKQNTEIVAALGEPIKGYGELSRRGRRRHVSHAEFDANGVHHMRMKFYIEGPERKGTVQLEVRQNDSGKYEYRYLFVELDGYPHRRIVLQDNR